MIAASKALFIRRRRAALMKQQLPVHRPCRRGSNRRVFTSIPLWCRAIIGLQKLKHSFAIPMKFSRAAFLN